MLSLALATAVLVATAGPPGPPPGERTPVDLELPRITDAECDKIFKEFDTNRDGKLSYHEYGEGKFHQLRFAMAPTEAQVKGHINQGKRMAQLCDRDKDGFLSLKEHRSACRQASF